MDKLQESRYWIRYGTYESASSLVDQVVREKISENLTKDKHLRADAALFLLVNFDQMIGSVSFRRSVDPGPTDPALSPDMIKSAFDVIVDYLEREDTDDAKGYSAHRVIKSIDASWDKLSSIFAWA